MEKKGVQELILSKDTVKLKSRGDSSLIFVTVYPSDYIGKDNIVWGSYNEKVAIVEKRSGEYVKIIGVGEGSTYVTVRLDGKIEKVLVTVGEYYKVTFTDGYGNVLKEEMVAKGKYANAPNIPTRQGYTFKGWDRNYHNIQNDLTVNATWKSDADNSISATGVKLNKTTATVTVGGAVQLTATVNPTNATNKGVTWSSSNTAVATVDANGKVTAKKAGTAKITVKAKDGGKTATCTVTVKNKKVNVTGVKLNKTTASATVGGTIQLAATVIPTNAANKGVTWTSSNTAVATVDSNGKVTAKKAGTAKITVKTKDGGKTATCTVTVKAKAAAKNGWKNENGSWKYYKDGKAYTGWHKMGKAEGEKTEHWSYFGKDGKIYTGWRNMGKNEGEKTAHWSYFGPNGWLRTGWQQMGKGTSNPDGNAAKHWSYFGSNGWLRTGWQWMDKSQGENTPHWSYFGGNGWLRTGMVTLGKADGEKVTHKSYFGSNGWLVTNKRFSVAGKTYTADGRGWVK